MNTLKLTRHRTRRPDSLASAVAVEAVLASPRASLPDDITQSQKYLIRRPQNVRCHDMRRPTDAYRGRPLCFAREELARIDPALRTPIECETLIGVCSFRRS